MPRIAAALGVFATLAFCVGFNAVQYPAVWKMVAPPSDSPQTGKPAEPVQPARPPAIAKPVPTLTPEQASKRPDDVASRPAPNVPAMSPSMPPVVKPVCDSASGVCRLPTAAIQESGTKVAAPGVDKAAPIGWPKETPPPKKKPCTTGSDPVKDSPKKPANPSAAVPAPATGKAAPRGLPDAATELVPVARGKKAPAASPEKAAALAHAPKPAETVREPKMVRRLPPVDGTAAVAISNGSAAADQQIPIYPSTGAR